MREFVGQVTVSVNFRADDEKTIGNEHGNHQFSIQVPNYWTQAQVIEKMREQFETALSTLGKRLPGKLEQ